MAEIPPDASRIGPDWLRVSVRPGDAAAFSHLNSVRAERLAEGIGTSTDIHRLHLGYAEGGARGPATLIAKLPSSNPGAREVARGWGMYQREVLFYRDIAATLSARVPKAYVAEFDPETHRFVLVMEDLSPAIGGDQIVGLPLEHARLALDAIAALHASWWNRPELAALEATVQPFGEGPWVGTGRRLAAAWPACETFLAGRVSPALTRVGDRLPSAIEALMVDMARAPRTLCHGDFRADNLMFAPSDAGTAVITLDWQAPLQARGAFDVGVLLSMSVTADLRRAYETDLLHAYHDKLAEGGVRGYGYDELFHDYRRGLLIGFCYVIQACAGADLAHARTEALFDSGVRRLDAAVEDHGLESFVA